MRRWSWVPMLLLLILVGVGVGIGAYHAGYNHGLVASGHVTEIVREGRFGFGFFLFPLFFFFLFLFVIKGLFFARHWGGGGHWGPGGGEHGDWKTRRGAMFDDWHRRQHEQASGDHPSAGGEPAGA